MPRKCWICKGSGKVIESEGWGPPMPAQCSNCRGTGRYRYNLQCGCEAIEGYPYIVGYACDEHRKSYPEALVNAA